MFVVRSAAVPKKLTGIPTKPDESLPTPQATEWSLVVVARPAMTPPPEQRSRWIMTDGEARSRLLSILDLLEHESQPLQTMSDPRLGEMLHAIGELRIEIAATVTELDGGIQSNRGSR